MKRADQKCRLQLTGREVLLIKYFRAMKVSAQHMMVDIAEEIADALPARLDQPSTDPSAASAAH